MSAARSSRRAHFVGLLAAACVAALACLGDAGAASGVLRVCADPNALPFSHAGGNGFENRLAALIAAERGQRVEYTWWAQRRGFLRNTLNAGACDVVMGLPVGVERVLSTEPYYSAAYAFVSRRSDALSLTSLDDPRLRGLRIGALLVGDDAANSPPVHALSRRGLIDNVRGYVAYGDYGDSAPLEAIVHGVARRDIDVAFVWGPVARYFAARSTVPLSVHDLDTSSDGEVPLRFAIGLAVRPSDRALRDELNGILVRRREAVRSILRAYSVEAPR